MMTVDDSGVSGRAKKATTIMSNSIEIAKELIRRGRCDGKHRHVPLMGGKAKACEEYPMEFCKSICRGIKHQLAADQRKGNNLQAIDVSSLMKKLIGALEQDDQGKLALMALEMETPHDDDELYEGLEFYDDASGQPLDKRMAIAARRAEMKFFRQRGVYSKIARESAKGPVIST
eukprot:9014096-Karenia_brevis.AAC.1